jgi:hypothetical protein
MSEEYALTQRDWLNDKIVSSLLWRLPPLVIVVTAFIDIGSTFRAVAWAGSLLVMSGGCFANAARCGRLHCYFTGPFFLFMAAIALLHGFEVIPFGTSGWWWIGASAMLGALSLSYVPEWISGKYAKRG